jgi:hypothetical protein
MPITSDSVVGYVPPNLFFFKFLSKKPAKLIVRRGVISNNSPKLILDREVLEDLRKSLVLDLSVM